MNPIKSFTTISFSGCAWLLTYHFGVIRFLQERKRPNLRLYAGASSGSVAALAVAIGLPIQTAFEFTCEMASDAQKRQGYRDAEGFFGNTR